jgi:hypothetical protein
MVVETDGASFCPYHLRLVEEHGAEVMKLGEHRPTPRKRKVQASVTAEGVAPTATGNGVADPASVRPRLAEAAAASLEGIQRVLLVLDRLRERGRCLGFRLTRTAQRLVEQRLHRVESDLVVRDGDLVAAGPVGGFESAPPPFFRRRASLGRRRGA